MTDTIVKLNNMRAVPSAGILLLHDALIQSEAVLVNGYSDVALAKDTSLAGAFDNKKNINQFFFPVGL